ncbi:MAG: hypothetical protein ACRENF_05060 [Thermodesulfobacteriota bacterium]
MTFKKGFSGNPRGRAPIVGRENALELSRNKGKIKNLINALMTMSEKNFAELALQKDLPKGQRVLMECIERAQIDGDIIKFKYLLEIAYGEVITKGDDFVLNEDEKTIIDLWRRMKAKGETNLENLIQKANEDVGEGS